MAGILAWGKSRWGWKVTFSSSNTEIKHLRRHFHFPDRLPDMSLIWSPQRALTLHTEVARSNKELFLTAPIYEHFNLKPQDGKVLILRPARGRYLEVKLDHILNIIWIKTTEQSALSAPFEHWHRESKAQSMPQLLLSAQEFYGVSYKRPFRIPKHGRFQAVLFPADM